MTPKDVIAMAKENDVILLSPGCTSWDVFKSFEHRGDFFKEIIKKKSAVSY